jgi:glycosyltransferase involved in cell wall biosynthesis
MKNQKLNILTIYDHFIPLSGGIENHLAYLFAFLKNCNITFLTLKEFENLPPHEETVNLDIFRIKKSRFYFLKYILEGIRLIPQKRVKLIHAHTLGVPSLSAVILGAVFRLPVIITIHESGFIMDMQKNNSIGKIKYRLMLKLASFGIATSDELRQYALKLSVPQNRVLEIPNGVDFGLFNAKVNQNQTHAKNKIILCPRRVTAKNGIEYLVGAIPLVLAQRKDVHFLFAGPICEKEYWQNICEMVEKTGIGSFITFQGNVPYSNMPEFYNNASIVVIPSLIEAVSLSALEGMASAKPIIATSVGGLPEIIKNGFNGLLVPPGNSTELAQAIIYLLDNETIAAQYAKNAVITAKEYSWQNVSDHTLSIYYKAISEKSLD